jgi:hypothetical protein
LTHSWRKLNQNLASLDEQQVKDMLSEEMENKKRATIITRLHQRFTTLRAARERKELLSQAVKL